MGFLDSLGDGLKKMGKAAIAAPGAVYDTATYVIPGDQWGGGDDSGLGGLLNSIGGRANNLTFDLGLPVLDKTMSALNTAYHEGVDRPLSTAMTMASHLDSGGGNTHYHDLFSGDAWAEAYRIADKQSLGQSIVYAIDNTNDPFADAKKAATPFQATSFYKDHPFLANATSLGLDLATSWYLDPAALGGKAIGVARQDLALGRLPETARSDFAARLDGSLVGTEKTFGKSVDWSGKFDRFFNYIAGDNKLNRPLNAAEIRAISPELKRSSGGLAISSALEDAMKLDDPEERINAARRVFAVAAGDTSAIQRLVGETGKTQALAWKLRNIVTQKTVDLQAQALNTALKDSPDFRAQFNAQLAGLDEADDLSKFIKDWHSKVASDLSGQRQLVSANRTLTNMPDTHPLGLAGMGTTAGKLRRTQGADVLSRVENTHDAIFDRIKMPQRDSYSTVYQQGLASLPVLAIYPTKFLAAMLPSKAIPKFVNGLRTVHFTGAVNLHDWDGASDQLNSMMVHAGVDNDVRLKQLSEVAKARTEMERLSAIHRTEQISMDGIARAAADKHGININRDFIQQAMLKGQEDRGRMISAMNGTRIYSTTLQPTDIMARSRGLAATRQAAQIDNATAAQASHIENEIGENWSPRVDQFIDHSGVPVTLPVVSSQLANRVPLIDVPLIKQLTNDAAHVKRLQRHSEAWEQASVELTGLQSQLARATGSSYRRLERQIGNVRKVQDQLLGTASVFNRWWKVSVLFRLGYPMRVIADDHMRIAARIGYIPFLMANTPEATRNTYYNYLPGVLGNTRRSDARKMYEAAKANRAQLVAHFGRDTAPSDKEWAEIPELHKTYFSSASTDAEKAAAKRRLDKIDPDGRVTEWADLTRQMRSIRGSISGKQTAIAKWREAGGNEEKIRQAEADITDLQGALAHTSEQLAGKVDPNELRQKIKDLDATLRPGPRNFRAPKKHLGEADVLLGKNAKVQGAFAAPAQGYYEATSSNASFDYILSDGEEMGFRLNSGGHWRSVAPGEPGYYQLWANILNHQFQHSPEFMSIVRGDVRTADEYASWLSKPEQRHLVDRMQQYAHDPHDWGGRLLAMKQDYVPSSELSDLMAQGKRVSARQLKRMFPEGDQRLPNIHGQMADVQSGRAGVSRAMSDGIQRAFRYLSEVPTDELSRHPFFNAIYKREVKAAYRAHVAEHGSNAMFGPDAAATIERIARQNALHELKQTLWDVSAHSHAAHTLRFLSPFFAAHQEALNRWWNIVADDPSIARKFQLAFDAPRKAGLTTNDNGELVKPGESIGVGNHIMLKLPFADDNNAVNKWLKKIGGGKYWSVNENGLNLILQNGLANPGVGPLVTIPIETLVQKYPEATEFEKAARVLNQYPPTGDNAVDIALGGVVPAWSKRAWALYRGEKSSEFANYYMKNFADELTTFRLQEHREPTENELKGLQDKANKATHQDLVLMMLTNAAGITPAKPNSRYAVVQNGLQRLYEQMRTEGHDMEWLRSTFRQQYGDAYMAMIYSMGSNPAHLQGSVAEVSAIKKHSTLMKHIDPSLARMVIGPEVEDADKAQQLYSSAAASWMSSQETGAPGENYRGKKDPREVAASLVVSQGWDQYDELTNYLDVLADDRGEDKGYEAYPDLVDLKRKGVDAIKAQNPVFAHSYDEYSQKSFDKTVDDMRLIASNKALLADPTRSDVYWLGQYIQIRDMMTNALKQRADAGGAKTMGASDNADLARVYSAAIQYINSKSSYFKQYDYAGVIEHDPYLVSTGAE